MSSDQQRLEHILEAIDQIRKHSKKGKEVFQTNELVQNWMVRHLQIIGEAASKLSPEFRSTNSEIPWKEIIGMRHILVHDYFEIDSERVWKVIEFELDRLELKIGELLIRIAANGE